MSKLYLYLGILALIGSLALTTYWQIKKNGELAAELKQRQATIEEAQREIDGLIGRLTVHQESVRKAVKERQQRDRDPGVSVDALQSLIERRSQ